MAMLYLISAIGCAGAWSWTALVFFRFIGGLGIGRAVMQVNGLTRPQLADLYRRAAALLVTSEAEGFGLPVVEALACGTAVIMKIG